MAGSDDMRPESRTKLTYDDFVLFPDDGMRHELIDVEPVGVVYLSPLDVVISQFDVVEPDLLYMSTSARRWC